MTNFDFAKLLQEILYVVVIGVLPIIVKYFTNLISAFVTEKADTLNNKKLANYVYMAQQAIHQAVLAVSQTYVDSLKNAGNFTPEAQAEAKARALALATEMITEDMRIAVTTLYGDFNTFLDTYIEQSVRATKITVANKE